MQQLVGFYNYWFVALSVVVAVFASYTALDLAGRVAYVNRKRKKLWWFCGSITMGIGIWSMHFIGMLAFHLPVTVEYDHNLVFLSVVAAWIGAFIALYTVSFKALKNIHFLIGGCSMGLAIGVMHYIGMAAMKFVDITYDPFLFALSIFIAIIASIAALKISFELAKYESSIRLFIYKILSAIAMGIAISGMHYTGMAAAEFCLPVEMMNKSGISNDTIVIMTGVTTIIIQSFLIFGTVTDRRFHFKALESLENEKRYRSLVHHNLDAIFSVSGDGQLLSMNPVGEKMFRCSTSKLKEKKISHFLTKQEKQKVKLYFYQTIEMKRGHNFNTRIRLDDNAVLDVNVTFVPIYIEDRLDCVYGIMRDITEQLENENHIYRLAYYDSLTSLPNRRNVVERIEGALKESGTMCAVYTLNLNRFKVINDALGQKISDLLLQHIAGKLTMQIGGRGVVGRMSGDTFIILLPNIKCNEEVSGVAEHVMQLFEKPFVIRGNELYCSVRIGIAIAPQDGVDAETLVGHADIAMYAAQESRKSGYRFYSPRIGEWSQNQLIEEQQLRQALEKDEFVLHYQPQVHSKTGKVVGVEALVRWQLPDGTMRSPLKFITLAEETGLIIPLGKLVLQKACQYAKEWHDKGVPIRVSVNLSPRQFQTEDIVETVAALLETYKLPPHLLELEVTESMTMTNVERSKRLLQAFRKLGVTISIDDFGTGHSSLSYLKDYPIHKLKIDRSFIKDIHEDVRTKQITAAIIALGQHIGLEIVAEGVEKEEQLAFLREHNCSYIQGYYFSKPLPPSEFERWLENKIVV